MVENEIFVVEKERKKEEKKITIIIRWVACSPLGAYSTTAFRFRRISPLLSTSCQDLILDTYCTYGKKPLLVKSISIATFEIESVSVQG